MKFRISKNIQDLIFLLFTVLSARWLRKVRSNIRTMTRAKRMLIKEGVFPILDRYWEPLFNPAHLKKSLREDRVLPGIDFNIKEQLEILNKFKFNNELVKFPLNKTDNLEFYYNNGNFEAGDAEYLYNIIRLFKPRKIIEIGSGNSTLMTLNAIEANKHEDANYKCEHICIEPYECSWLEKMDIGLIRKRAQEVDKDIFISLGANDLLFIDSSHIIRPQGDVLLEYLEILPILKPGVIVHIHDIFTPKDYLDEWIVDEVRFWNEQYLLEAFLTFNSKFKIIGTLNFLKHHYFSELVKACPVLYRYPTKEPASVYLQKLN